MINPLKVLLFLAGGTAVVAAGAYVSGALDPLFTDEPQAVASLPAEPAPSDAATPVDPAAPKQDRVEQEPDETPVATEQQETDASETPDPAPPPASDIPAAAEQPADQPDAAADTPVQTSPIDQPEVASGQQEGDEASVDEDKPADVAALDPQAPVTQPAPEPAPPAASAALPTFDVVRVEADGSMVIAGKAAPNVKVELMAGGKIVGSATAGADGDFVVVLDEPLAPGDYQITIHATASDGSATESAQTAIVSIPADAGGQVLAMIEEPGKPSQIVTVPQPATPAGEAPGETKPDQVAAADPNEPAEQPAAGTSADAADGAPASDTAKPADEAAASDAATPPEAGGSTGAETPSAANATEDAAQPPADGPEVAAASPEADEPAIDAPAAPAIDVAVEAVEIDGSQVFVAGRAPAGAVVRVYANEILLGDAVTSPSGRFLVEANQDLPVGNYVVRVDVLGADGAEVIARAAVPFVREPGENIAAVAPPAEIAPADQNPADTAADESSSGEPDEQPAASAEQPAASAEATAPATDQGSGGDQAGASQAAEEPAAGSDDQTTPTAVAQAPDTDGQSAPPADVETQAPATAEQTPPAAVTSESPAATEPPPAAVAETPPTSEPPASESESAPPAGIAEATPPADEIQAPVAADETASPPATAEAAAPEPASPPTAAETSPPAEGGQPEAGGSAEVAAAPPAEVTAPPLQSVDSAVIIRRGDTLWRISRRVYGRGVRYSTIYLANQDQIRDPDMIWPGQVFTVPDRTSEGEAADMSKMGEQVVPKAQ